MPVGMIPPEFQFVREIEGVKYYQFGFAKSRGNMPIQMAQMMGQVDQFRLTLAVKGDIFTLKIQDSLGLDWNTSDEGMTASEFEFKWKKFLSQLSR